MVHVSQAAWMLNYESVMDLTWKRDRWALASLATFRLELLLPIVGVWCLCAKSPLIT